MQAILTLIAFIIPFQVALSPLVGFDIALIRILILIATLLFLAHIALKKSLHKPPLTLPLLIIAFLLWTFLSLLAAYDLLWFARKFVFLTNFFLLFFIIITTIQSRHAILNILRATVLGGILSATITLSFWAAQFIFGTDKAIALWQKSIAPIFLGQATATTVATYSSAYVNVAGTDYLRAVGLFPDPHVAAFYFELLIPITLFFAITVRNRRSQFFYYTGTFLLTAATLATFTRGAYVAIAVGIAFATTTALFTQMHRATRKNVLISTLLMIGFLAVIITFSPLSSRVASIFTNHDTSISERLTIWHDTVAIIRDAPLFGVGLGNYALSFAPHADYRDPYYAHNLYLDIAAEMGLPALLLWYAIIILTLWHFSRNINPVLRVAGMTSIVIYSTHSLFDTALYSVHVLPLLLIIIALSLYKSGASHKVPINS